jgi:ubiquinone/menaquinone biosynthesis C-methylase UbiE
MIEAAAANYPEVKFAEGDAEDLPFEDGCFDCVACSFGLLHMQHPEKVMEEAYRVLRSGGRWTNLYPHTAESIRRSVPQDKVDFSNAPQNGLEAFLRRINRNTVAAARALTRQYDFSSTKTLADVGCGGAGLALTMIKELPHIKATAIDLPLVAPIAQKIVAEEGATDRVHVLAADLLSGPLPGSYDTVILRGVLQCLSAEEARLAVKNIAAAVNPGGTLFIVAQILDDSRISPLEALGYNLIFINTFDAGESYTEQEHRAWLTEAGFVHIERANFLLPDEHGLMTARKPR